MTIGTDDLDRISKATTVLSTDGERLGTVEQVYTSDTSGEPAWVTLATGSHGAQESFVPLAGASFDGFNIKTAVSRDAVEGAQRVDAGGHLGVEEEDDLYRYYGIDNPDHTEDQVADDVVGTQPAEPEGRDEAVVRTPPVSGESETTAASDQSDGQDPVRPGERVTRLRRYVVTERVVQTIEELPDDDPR